MSSLIPLSFTFSSHITDSPFIDILLFISHFPYTCSFYPFVFSYSFFLTFSFAFRLFLISVLSVTSPLFSPTRFNHFISFRHPLYSVLALYHFFSLFSPSLLTTSFLSVILFSPSFPYTTFYLFFPPFFLLLLTTSFPSVTFPCISFPSPHLPFPLLTIASLCTRRQR